MNVHETSFAFEAARYVVIEQSNPPHADLVRALQVMADHPARLQQLPSLYGVVIGRLIEAGILHAPGTACPTCGGIGHVR